MRVQGGTGCGVQGAGCRAQGAECRVQGEECRVQGAGCRVHGCRVHEVGGKVEACDGEQAMLLEAGGAFGSGARVESGREDASLLQVRCDVLC